MAILEKIIGKKRKSGDPVKVVSVEEIKKEAAPEIDGYERIGEFQKTGIPYFLKLARAGSKKAVANLDIYSFQVTELRDLIADRYGGDTYIGTLVDTDMHSVLIPKTNKPETYIFRIDGPPPKVEKPQKAREPKAEGLTPDKIKDILTVVGGFLGPVLGYLIKFLESRGDEGQKTLLMAKELMELTAGPSVQDMVGMMTGLLEGTIKMQNLTHPTPPISTGDGAAALGQGGLVSQFITALAAGAAQGLMSGGNDKGQLSPGQAVQALQQAGQTQEQSQQGPALSGTTTTGQATATGVRLPAPDIAGKLLEMANRNEDDAVIAEQIVTLLDGYRRSTNPLYPQFAHYLDNPEMAFDTILKLFPVLNAWPGREGRIRRIVYAICAHIKEQEEAEEDQNELYAGNREDGSEPERQGAGQATGLFDEAPVRFSAEPIESEPQTPDPEPQQGAVHGSTESMGRDENQNPDGQKYGGPGPVHSEEHPGEAREAE